ncbi:MAG: tyramine oxidase, partial [Paracoccaceae bacterium]
MDGLGTLTGLHPLSPLTADEIEAASKLVLAELPNAAEARFEAIELAEPDKAAVRAHQPGDTATRSVWVNAYTPDRPGVVRSLVSLTDSKIVESRYLPDVTPMIAPEEFMEVENAVKADPRFQAAITRRGLDLEMVTCDPWSAGNFGVAEEVGRRVSYVHCWVRNSALDNQYAHPIQGLNATVDIATGEVLSVRDVGDVPVPRGEGNYDREFQTEVRQDLRPINVVQPEGVSFHLDGHRLTWADWDLRIG